MLRILGQTIQRLAPEYDGARGITIGLGAFGGGGELFQGVGVDKRETRGTNKKCRLLLTCMGVTARRHRGRSTLHQGLRRLNSEDAQGQRLRVATSTAPRSPDPPT